MQATQKVAAASGRRYGCNLTTASELDGGRTNLERSASLEYGASDGQYVVLKRGAGIEKKESNEGSRFEAAGELERTSKQDQKWAFDEFLFCTMIAVEEEREEEAEVVELGQVVTWAAERW